MAVVQAGRPPLIASGSPYHLAAESIHKAYGRKEPVLKGASLAIAPGEVIGLVGPNGAGKTTLLSILAGIFPPDSGTVWLDGEQVNLDWQPQRRRALGVLLGGVGLVGDLRPREYFDLFAGLAGVPREVSQPRAEELLAALRFGDDASRLIRQLSAGTRKKVELVASLLHEPSVLLFDEPFESLDPLSVHVVTKVIRDYVTSRHASALISSHILPYVRPLATDIRFLWDGQLYDESELTALIRQEKSDTLDDWRAVLQGDSE
ncbi:hypothetical protein AYO38_10080 [bacterium SCGC AG-212-C10]|nr:hypothetical protein AYO38_10080 [bacterium SCGC AG-212-C10]